LFGFDQRIFFKKISSKYWFNFITEFSIFNLINIDMWSITVKSNKINDYLIKDRLINKYFIIKFRNYNEICMFRNNDILWHPEKQQKQTFFLCWSTSVLIWSIYNAMRQSRFRSTPKSWTNQTDVYIKGLFF